MELLKFLSFCCLLYQVCHAVHGDESGKKLQVGADSSVIRQEALSLLLRTQHTQPGEESRVFPGLVRFTCPGNITSILFIAEPNAALVEEAVPITFRLWETVKLTDREFTGRMVDAREVSRRNIELVSQRGDSAIYRATLQSPLKFDFDYDIVLGIDQSPGLAIQYAYGWGRENYVLSTSQPADNVSVFLNSPIAVQDYPLLALENNLCESCLHMCAEGLLLSPADLELFLTKNTNPRVMAPFLETPSVSPLLRFSGDGSIMRWAVNRHMSSATVLPQLQIWRLANSDGSGEKRYQRVNGSSTNIEDNLEDMKTVVNQQISFRDGDILAVSSSQRVVLGDVVLDGNFRSSGFGSSGSGSSGFGSSGFGPGDEEYELGAIEITLFIDPDDMDPEFDTSQLFVQHVINTPIYNHPNLSVILSDKYEVIPEFRIPHSGMLTRWLFAARLSLTLSRDNPQLHVWRRLPNKVLDAYFLVHSANLQLDRGSSLGTYEYTLEIPAPVKAGDILGFYQPPWDVLQFNLAVLNNEGPLVHELTLGHFDPFFVAINSSKTSYRALPLMSAELLPDPDIIVTTTTRSPPPSPTATVQRRKSDDDDPLGRNDIIAVVVVCTISILIGVAVIALIVVFFRKWSRNTRTWARNSIDFSMQEPSHNGDYTAVQLHSHNTTPYIDFDSQASSPKPTQQANRNGVPGHDQHTATVFENTAAGP